MTPQEFKWVYSYNNDPFRRTKYFAPEGTKIEWKRNGHQGCVRAIILGYSEEKPDFVFVQNWVFDWSAPYSERANVWIKRKSVLRVID